MKKNRTIVIAEAGVNHNGRLDVAKRLINKAKNAGADIIKFQTFLTEKLITKYAEKTKYQKRFKPNESIYTMLQKLELSFKEFKNISKLCKKKKIEFLSTGFDIESIKFLQSLKLKENTSFIEYLAKKDKDRITNLLKNSGYYFSEVKLSIVRRDLCGIVKIMKMNLVDMKKVRKMMMTTTMIKMMFRPACILK